ncbi:MAG: undecaprenyl-diphosphate phosphatase [Candidatus Caenarcaniphilales bacterium]|nr:undecaprenyl-diphosphate phosphatase [Candidatus Caenarcaniphilales bacterium]
MKNKASSSIFRSLALGFVQGLTEFLPLSSSFHLHLCSKLFGFREVKLKESCLLHGASLLAVLIVLWQELKDLAIDAFQTCFNLLSEGIPAWNEVLRSPSAKIILISLPCLLTGYFLRDFIKRCNQNYLLNIILFIFFGILLPLGFIWNTNTKSISEINFSGMFLLGCVQVIALIRGVSRLGIVLTFCGFLNLAFDEAFKFSIILSVPIILASFGYELYKSLKDTFTEQKSLIFHREDLLGFLFSLVLSYLTLKLILLFLQEANLIIFAFYRLILGCWLLIRLYKDKAKV